jgi:hypothetical protein
VEVWRNMTGSVCPSDAPARYPRDMSHVCGSASAETCCRRSGCGPEAAAEATGRRARLTCRPYRLPRPAGNGPQPTCWAACVIPACAPGQHSEARPAMRHGVSGRHLRWMRVTHLGVTPDSRSWPCRAHFVRRLLDDSDISITEMAGFAPVRQLSRDGHKILCDLVARVIAAVTVSSAIRAHGPAVGARW